VRGNVGYGSGAPVAVFAGLLHSQLDNGSQPQVAFTMRRLASPILICTVRRYRRCR